MPNTQPKHQIEIGRFIDVGRLDSKHFGMSAHYGAEATTTIRRAPAPANSIGRAQQAPHAAQGTASGRRRCP